MKKILNDETKGVEKKRSELLSLAEKLKTNGEKFKELNKEVDEIEEKRESLKDYILGNPANKERVDKQKRNDRRMDMRSRDRDRAHEALQRDLERGEPTYQYMEENPITGNYHDVTDKYFG